MNRSQFIFLLVAMAFIGGAGFILVKRNRESWTGAEVKMGDKLLPNFRFNDVTAINIKGSSELHVLRKNGQWRVQERGDYPANYPQIKELLIKIRDLKVVQSEAIGSSDLSRVDLDQPGKRTGGGLLLEFKNEQGKTLDSLLLGKKHARQESESASFNLNGFFNGRYILLPGDPKNVFLISDELASVSSEPEAWVSRDFFKVENIKSLALISINPTNSWKVSRETKSSPWILIDSKPDESLDTALATQIAETLEFPRFTDVLSNETHVETNLPKATMTIETFDQFVYTLKISPKRPDGNYQMTVAVAATLQTKRTADKSKVAEEKEIQEKTKSLSDKLAQEQTLAPWVYVVDSWIEPLLRDRGQILEKKVSQSIAADKPVSATTQ